MEGIPYTLGYDVDKAKELLQDHHVVVEETSTPFNDKKEERSQHIPIVVRQLYKENCVYLTVAKFK